MPYSITKQDRLIDVDQVMNDDRYHNAIDDIAEAVAIDERTRPLWPECPMDQMYASLNEWKEAMLAARDYKMGELSATAYRARLARTAAVLVRGMMHIEDEP